jgi:hypothetical protein
MDKQRAEFESFIKSETGFDVCRTEFPMTRPENQQYMDHHTNLAWIAWQAAQKAAVPDGWVDVEDRLPEVGDLVVVNAINGMVSIECYVLKVTDYCLSCLRHDEYDPIIDAITHWMPVSPHIEQ